ncbi:MAG: hypothetical protein ABSC19_14295 [Syntrophorhabdales bacterium]
MVSYIYERIKDTWNIVGKIARGGFIFISWKGDHGRHAHIFPDGEFVVKWDIENWKAMRGQATGRIISLLKELLSEGRL